MELDFFKGALQKVEARRQQKDGSGARHLRPNPGSDVLARQHEYRADVSIGASESRRLLSLIPGTSASERRDGSAVHDPADRAGALQSGKCR